jgi:hypothetical protein
MIPSLHLRSEVRYPASVTTGFLGGATHLQVLEECGKHTIFVVRHAGHAKYAQESLRSGAPMTVSITSRKGRRRWHGYVDSVTPYEEPGSNAPYTRVVGVGLTYPLKEPTNVVAGKVRDGQRQIIRRNGLVPIVRGPDSERQMLLGGRSQWEVLAETAKEYSQYLFTTGTTVHAMQLKDIIDMYRQEAVTLVWMGGAAHSTNQFVLRQFKIPTTDNTGALGVVPDHRIAFGVDPHTARVTQREEGDSMFSRYPGYVAQSYGNVVDRLSGSTVTHVAQAQGTGHIGITAGKPVFVRGSDPGPWWLVNSVCHEYDMEQNAYDMSLELHRAEDLRRLSPEVFAPERNIHRVGDFGEAVNLENEPVLYVPPQRVRGATMWREGARWRAQR